MFSARKIGRLRSLRLEPDHAELRGARDASMDWTDGDTRRAGRRPAIAASPPRKLPALLYEGGHGAARAVGSHPSSAWPPWSCAAMASKASFRASTAKAAKKIALTPKTSLSLSFRLLEMDATPTADPVSRKKATVEPAKTGISGWEACCPIMANCVRSPNSARKTPPKDFVKAFHSTPFAGLLASTASLGLFVGALSSASLASGSCPFSASSPLHSSSASARPAAMASPSGSA
mmetsp:Transcript_51696/g.133329  ORF Transcript_51696/g.133329 Transcript_51696/m.133329 type:complete len:234 (+) Transcript_51696:202-903(+)